MKKIILTLLMIILSLTSCTYNNELENNIENSKIKAVFYEKNASNQKIMYNMLNKEEKLKLWEEKIENVLQKNNLNEDQLILINDLKDNLSANLFDNKSFNNEKEIFKSIYVKEFLKKSINVFEEDFIVTNFYSLSSNGYYLGEPDAPENGENPDCSCNTTSMWSCAASFECKTSRNCSDTAGGCGFLGMFECNGRCFLI